MNKDSDKTKAQLLAELAELRKRSKEQEDNLKASNQQLQAVNQHLDAQNQQLQATEQQLMAGNQQLTASEAKFKSYIQNAPDGIFIANEKGKYVEVNKAACEITGYSEDELLKLTIPELIQEEFSEKAGNHFQTVVKEGFASDEMGFVTKSGEKRFWSVDAVKLSETRFLGFAKDITERKHMEEMMEKRMVALSQPLESSAEITFEELFNIADIQKLQDQFTEATGVASIITQTDGTPITGASNFCRLCSDIIRKTDKGLKNCYKSDAVLGKYNPKGPSIQPCLSGGLWDAGAAITVGGKHIANWLIGQVRDETQSDEKMKAYATEIGADEEDVLKAFHEVPAMSLEQFEKVSQTLFTLANQLSASAYQNVQQARFINERKKAEEKLRESEEKLSTLFESMTEMVVLHELVLNEKGEPVNYRITDCNNAFTAVTGIKKENAVGKLATEVYQTEIAPYLDEFSNVATTGKPYEYTTYFVPFDKHFSISVVSPKQNQFATITTDITAIQQVQKVISDKNKELENYLYVASHDLRTPLVNVQGFSNRLQKQVDSIKRLVDECSLAPEAEEKIESLIEESIPKTLDFISTNVKKMDVLINGLLEISRTGRVKMTIKKIDINRLFEKIISSMNFQITEISAKVITNNMPACYGDENLLSRLFTNVLTNAIKYRNQEIPLIIEISSETNYNKIIYRFKDNGIGIEKRHLGKIWDVFYRVGTVSSETGEGIGLSLAKRIVDKHKGKIWAESEEGKGSVFSIELLTNEFSE